MLSGAPNEVWSYGPEILAICTTYLRIREQLRPYTRSLMQAAHRHGNPVMRPCFYDFPEDAKCWEVEDQYMYGPKYCVAPVLKPGAKTRKIYLPPGKWQKFVGEAESNSRDIFEGGKIIEVQCAIETMPVFERLS
jgi:alpha-D-xyloside xylohydrolase